MSNLGALPIVEAVDKVINIYNGYYPDTAKFSITTNSALLETVDVLQALLHHAIAPSTVALEFWKFLQAYFNDVLERRGDHTHPQSVVLVPHHGQWKTVDAKLLNMSETTLGGLTEDMNTHAREWMTKLLLPSMFVAPLPLRGAEMAIHSPLPREDPG